MCSHENGLLKHKMPCGSSQFMLDHMIHPAWVQKDKPNKKNYSKDLE